jgi:hypothetical protein
VVDELLPVEDQSLTELHGRAGRPVQRAGTKAGHIDDDLLAFSNHIFDQGDGDEDGEDADQCTPREAWKRWRAYARRHGTEDPERTADRIQRYMAAEAARMAKIDDNTDGRVQDRFDSRTSGNVASNARQSRAINARHVDQPPVSTPSFDFRGRSFDGDPYRHSRAPRLRQVHAQYAWNMEDGFRF